MNLLNIELLQSCSRSNQHVCLSFRKDGKEARIFVGEGRILKIQGVTIDELTNFLVQDAIIAEMSACPAPVANDLDIVVEELCMEMCQFIDESRILTVPTSLKTATVRNPKAGISAPDEKQFVELLSQPARPLNFSTGMTREIILGRAEDCDLSFPGDRLISRRHCTFKFQKGDLYIRDLDSYNGTFVNRQPISETTLNSGDEVIAGVQVFKVQIFDLGPGRESAH